MPRFTTIIDQNGNPGVWDSLAERFIPYEELEWDRKVIERYSQPGAHDDPDYDEPHAVSNGTRDERPVFSDHPRTGGEIDPRSVGNLPSNGFK